MDVMRLPGLEDMVKSERKNEFQQRVCQRSELVPIRAERFIFYPQKM